MFDDSNSTHHQSQDGHFLTSYTDTPINCIGCAKYTAETVVSTPVRPFSPLFDSLYSCLSLTKQGDCNHRAIAVMLQIRSERRVY